MAIAEVTYRIPKTPHKPDAPPRRQRRSSTFIEAVNELETYFATADATLGMHGTGWEGGGAVVWDALRIHLAHIAPRYLEHRVAMEKLSEIVPTVLQFRIQSPAAWTDCAMTFQPRGWPDKLGERLSRGARGGNLIGLALSGSLLRASWIKRATGRLEADARRLKQEREPCPEPTPIQLLDFAHAESEVQDAPRVHRFFEPLRREAEARLEKALAIYDGLMRARRRGEVQQAIREAAGQ